MRDEVVPAGHEHEVRIGEFFFSVTDAGGVIELANATFVRLSHYPHGELIGAPHNIIRHPDMPAGAFKLVWDQLRAGKPACAYVANLAADGGTYHVFATLLPVGDRLLSVRMRPLVPSLREASERLYAQIRPVELAARADGASRDEAAELGLGLLLRGLETLGMADADDLALVTLPAELAAYERVAGGLPRRQGAVGPMADLLAAMHDVQARTAGLVAQLDEYSGLIAALESSYADAAPVAARLLAVADATAEGSRLEAVVDAARAAAVQMWEAARAAGCERDVPGPAVLDVGARICGHAQAADDGLRGLGVDLAALADEVRWLRMRIALLRRHNLMVGTFAVELLDGEPGGKVGAAGDALASMELLCRALTEGAQELSAAHGRVRAATREIPGTVQEAVRLGDRILRLARRWRAEVVAYGVADAAAPQLTALDEHTAEGFDELRRFHAVAARCRLLDDAFDPLGLREAIGAMAAALTAYGSEVAA